MEVLSRQARTPSPGPSAYNQSSPLDTLVRRASSRRVRNKDALAPVATTPSRLPVSNPSTPPRNVGENQEWPPPASPLLHTQFRNSTATTATATSYLPDTGSTYDTSMSSDGWGDSPRRPTSNVDSKRGQILSVASEYDLDDITASYRDSYASSGTSTPHPGGRFDPSPSPLAVPTVVVSSADPDPFQSQPIPPGSAGRAPSRLPASHKAANFSRPVPPVIDGTEDRKRQVLARNGSRTAPPLMYEGRAEEVSSLSGFSQSSRSRPTSPNLSAQSSPQQAQARSPPTSPSIFQQQQQQHPPGSLPNPYGPPPRSASPSTSVYSSYSYYPYDGALPTPTGSTTHLGPRSPTTPGPSNPSHPSSRPHSPRSPASPTAPPEPITPFDYLQLGIQSHLANDLTKSAQYFEKSATLEGGCGVGMLMWGLTLRHGWGVEKSEAKGFKWLKKAAEIAVVDLESARGGMDAGVVQNELVLAIYEVGQSFFRGWGVEKDKKMGVSYFRVAARLGDPDAQQELAFCLANGKGCKKDRKEAAKWYRAAVAQGVSDIGLAWIYKEKFQD
ncbi:unnamed protein product [Somion occarium]|uniref:HCP-like protein n=2 Tax=Somion occarium TaxID=3059160 RepID=A0ABP1CMZ0_9APHY